MRTVVVALGGNVLTAEGQAGTLEEQESRSAPSAWAAIWRPSITR